MYHVMEYCQTCGFTETYDTDDPAEDGMTDTVPMCEYCHESRLDDAMAESVCDHHYPEHSNYCVFCGAPWRGCQ